MASKHGSSNKISGALVQPVIDVLATIDEKENEASEQVPEAQVSPSNENSSEQKVHPKFQKFKQGVK